MSEIVVSSEDLTVFGGPATVNVEVDFGPSGSRGSYIYNLSDSPNNFPNLLPSGYQLNDMVINVGPQSDEYLYMYQYISQDGTLTWKRLFRLIPNLFNKNYASKSFTDGIAEFAINLIDIVPSDRIGVVTSASFNIQASVINTTGPVSISVGVGEVTLSNTLPITLTAIQFDGTNWAPLPDNTYTIHMSISVV